MAIDRDDAKIAWLQIQNRIIEDLNEKVRPIRAKRIALNDVHRSTLSVDELPQGVRRFFEDLISKKGERVAIPSFCIRAGLLVDPRQHVLTNDLLVFVRKFFQADGKNTTPPRPNRKTWNSDFVKTIAANNTSAVEWFDEQEPEQGHDVLKRFPITGRTRRRLLECLWNEDANRFKPRVSFAEAGDDVWGNDLKASQTLLRLDRGRRGAELSPAQSSQWRSAHGLTR